MKKLGKLKLKEEKMLSSEELVFFRGGSGEGKNCDTYCNASGTAFRCIQDSLGGGCFCPASGGTSCS
jgi:natural product precursor